MSIHTAKRNNSDSAEADTKKASAEAIFESARKSFGFHHRKNVLALKDLTSIKVYELATMNPTWELKDVMAEVLNEFPSEMPTDVLLEMIQFIFGEWETHVKVAA